MLRIVKACQEVAAAAQLQQVCAGVQSHVPDVEQSCIMLQYMLQEVADLGISGVAWSPAKVHCCRPQCPLAAASSYAKSSRLCQYLWSCMVIVHSESIRSGTGCCIAGCASIEAFVHFKSA